MVVHRIDEVADLILRFRKVLLVRQIDFFFLAGPEKGTQLVFP